MLTNKQWGKQIFLSGGLLLLCLSVFMTFIGCTKVEKYPNGHLKYKGEWKDDKANGQGVEFFEDERTKFEGQFVNGLYEGKGTLYIELLGDQHKLYEGNFKAGKYDGYGVLYNPNTNEKTEGYFKNMKLNGHATLYNPDGTKYFEGEYKDDIENGTGIEFYPNGSKKLEGEYVKGVLVNGTQYNEEGKKIYTGDFKNSNWSGKGVEYYPENEGKKCEGTFDNGSFIEGRTYDKSGYEYITVLYYYNSTINYHDYISFSLDEVTIKKGVKIILKPGDDKFSDFGLMIDDPDNAFDISQDDDYQFSIIPVERTKSNIELHIAHMYNCYGILQVIVE